MNYDRLIIELLNRTLDLEREVDVLKREVDVLKREKTSEFKVLESSPSNVIKKISRKYDAISNYLRESKNDQVKLYFIDIVENLKIDLPPSAYNHKCFWANTKTHSMALSWLNVGYKVIEIDIKNKYIIFKRAFPNQMSKP